MGHKNNDIFKELINKLIGMQAFGTSKHIDKQNHDTQNKIYSYSTFENYKKVGISFATYVKKEHKCKNLSQAQQYVGEFLSQKIKQGYSPWSIKLYACALGKLYQVPSNSFIELPTRTRHDITRSREFVARDKHFSESKNSSLVNFCKSI